MLGVDDDDGKVVVEVLERNACFDFEPRCLSHQSTDDMASAKGGLLHRYLPKYGGSSGVASGAS